MESYFVSFSARSLELIILTITLVVNLLLAFVVYRANPKSATNRIFLLLSVFIALWLVAIYIVRLPALATLAVFLQRLGIFFAAPISTLFLLLAHTLPSSTVRLSKKNFLIVVSATIFMMVLNISPYAFVGGEVVDGVIRPKPGIGLAPFSIISTIFSALAIYFLIRRFRKAVDEERAQLRSVMIGMFVMLVLVIGTILIPILIFNSGFFVPITPAYTLVFLGMTAYAIVRHHLFDLKVIATELLVAVLWVVTIANALSVESVGGQIMGWATFAFLFVFGLLLIRSVRKEVNQRERLELLTKELQIANTRLKVLDDLKTDFISIASHQLRTPLTAIKGYSSMILEGVYGDTPLTVRGVVDKIFQSAQRLIFIVNDLLDVSRIEQGRMQLAFEEVKALNVLKDVVEELKPTADKKGISLELKVSIDDAEIIIKADYSKLRQVFTNIIDNSLKYTPSGFVHVSLERKKDAVVMSVKDSGIGLSEETMTKLFQKFSRARGATRLRADGSGLGLYIVKEIVKAHGGEAWAESEGEGKGSQFYVSLPIHNPAAEAAQQFVEGV